MMFPKRWKGQLRGHRSCSPIHCLQIYVSPLSFFSLLPPLPLFFFSSHIFNIINIDRAVHLEPFYNNWLRSLMLALMVSAGGWRREGGRVLNRYKRFMYFHMNNPPMPRSGIVLHTDDLIGVTVTRVCPSSHHHGVLSLAKCCLFMDISWERSDEVILATLWLALLELSWRPDPPCLNDDRRGPPRLDGFQSARLNHLMNLTEERETQLRLRIFTATIVVIAFNCCWPSTVQTEHVIVLLFSLLANV